MVQHAPLGDRHGPVDYVLPLDRIGAKLVELLDHHAGLTPTGATS